MHARTLLTVLVGLTCGLAAWPIRPARSQEAKTPAQAAPAQATPVQSAPAQAAPAQAAPAQAAPEVVTFQEHILPIFRRHCATCHNPDKATSDLNLISYPAVLAGGASGEAISPGKPEQSLLYRVVAHLDEPAMPPKQPRLPAGELAAIKRWIELGAPDTRAGAARSAARSLEVDPATLTAGKPEGPPPMPQQLPAVTVPHTSRAHPVTALAASPWAPLIAVSGHECILLYHAETLAPLGILPFPERIPFVLRFSRNGKLLLAAGGRGASSGLVVLFDVTSGQRVAEIGEEVDAVLAADLSPDHRWVALGGSSRLVKIYETSTGELRHRLKKHTDWVTALEFSPQGDLLASGDRNGGAYIWEVTTGGVVFTLGDHRESISDLSWRADSQVLATASEDGRVILWFAEDGFPTRSINAHAPTGTPRNASPRNRLPGVLGIKYAGNGTFGTVGRDATARLWRGDGNQLARFEGFTDVPSRVVLSHDGQRLFAGDYTGQVRVWNVADQKLVGQVSTNP